MQLNFCPQLYTENKTVFMKKISLLFLFVLPGALFFDVTAQNVGIGNTTPGDRLHVTGGEAPPGRYQLSLVIICK